MPRFGDKVHEVAAIEDGSVVVDTQGERGEVQLAKPMPRGSTDARPEQFARRGSAQVDAKKRTLLKPDAKNVVRHIGRGNEMELRRVGKIMKRHRGLNDIPRGSGPNMESEIANCLKASPELFTITTTTDGGAVTVAA